LLNEKSEELRFDPKASSSSSSASTPSSSRTSSYHYTHDFSSRAPSSNQIPTFTSKSLPVRPSIRCRRSSDSSSFTSSSRTPPLSRSGSSDSTDLSRTMQPSPLTPDFASFDPATFPSVSGQGASPEYQQKQQFYSPVIKDGLSATYEQLPIPLPFTFPPSAMAVPPAQQQTFMPASVPVAPPAPPVKAAEPPKGSTSKAQSKKNHYPCPMAQTYNCNDYFTTSGHAARHAKKHTGRKDAICPECNKAFTRKDNMEQHRRTHQNGRNTQKASDDGASSSSRKAKAAQPPANKRPRISPLQPTATAMAPVSVEEPALLESLISTSPVTALPFSDHASLGDLDIAQLQPATGFGQTYPDPNLYAYDPALATPTFPSTAALDQLAMAATDVKRTDAERKRKHGAV
jgi:hypothetical protein